MPEHQLPDIFTMKEEPLSNSAKSVLNTFSQLSELIDFSTVIPLKMRRFSLIGTENGGFQTVKRSHLVQI
jgi:hypothetical protein